MRYEDPKPPTRRRIVHHKRRKHYKIVPSEFHEMLFSFGIKNNTKHLSDAEFAGQFVEELGYLAKSSVSNIRKATDAAVNLFRNIFCN